MSFSGLIPPEFLASLQSAFQVRAPLPAIPPTPPQPYRHPARNELLRSHHAALEQHIDGVVTRYRAQGYELADSFVGVISAARRMADPLSLEERRDILAANHEQEKRFQVSVSDVAREGRRIPAPVFLPEPLDILPPPLNGGNFGPQEILNSNHERALLAETRYNQRGLPVGLNLSTLNPAYTVRIRNASSDLRLVPAPFVSVELLDPNGQQVGNALTIATGGHITFNGSAAGQSTLDFSGFNQGPGQRLGVEVDSASRVLLRGASGINLHLKAQAHNIAGHEVVVGSADVSHEPVENALSLTAGTNRVVADSVFNSTVSSGNLRVTQGERDAAGRLHESSYLVPIVDTENHRGNPLLTYDPACFSAGLARAQHTIHEAMKQGGGLPPLPQAPPPRPIQGRER